MSDTRRKTDGTESTGETGKDLKGTDDNVTKTWGATPRTYTRRSAARKGSSTKDEQPRDTTEKSEKQIVREDPSPFAVPKKKVSRPRCPVCGENRFYDKRRGQSLKCVNCRRIVVIK